jgi:signal transduction histidine kinase
VDVRAWELFDPAIAPASEDLRPFLREALRRGSDWFQACSASAFLAEGPGEYILAAQFGGIPLPIGTVLRAGVAQAAINAREPLLIDDPSAHPRLRGTHVKRRSDVASAMVLPLILPDGEAVGVINLARQAGVPPYGPEDLEQARRMASHFAIAVGLAIRTAAVARAARKEAQSRHLAEVGRMTAVLAHEIRNPLAVIRAAAQLATEAPEYLATVIEESDRLEALLQGFLDFSKPVDVNPQRTDLPQLLQRLAAREEAAFRKAEVAFTVHAQPAEAVQIDPHRIEQACRNLLQNAREAAGSGGNVTLRVWRDGFEVVDDGPGLSKEVRESLFTPFVTAKPRGTGLGLTVVQRVAEAHGGRVVVGEHTGRGASFRVELGVAA